MPKRSYRQYCAVARALDVVGDRWNLLIVRNLLLGPQSWTELRSALPGIAKNLLSERLKQLEQDGIVSHGEASYGLTQMGRELEPIVFGLANWAEEHLMGPPHEEDAFRLRYLMTSIRRKLRSTDAEGSLQLVVGGLPFWVKLGPQPIVRQGEADADVVVRCGVAGIRSLVFERISVAELVDQSLLRVDGDHELVRAFRDALRR